MGRGGKSRNMPDCKRSVGSKDKGSDDSDEDYTVGVDEIFEDSEGYCSSLVGDESDECFDHEDEMKVVKRADRTKRKRGFLKKKKDKGGNVQKSRLPWKEEEAEDSVYKDEEDYVDDHNDHEDDPNDEDKDADYRNEDDEDGDSDDDDDDDDEEFTPDEVDLDLEDEVKVVKRADRTKRKRGFLEKKKDKVGNVQKSRLPWKEEEEDSVYKDGEDYVDECNDHEDDHNDEDKDADYRNEDDEDGDSDDDDDDEEFTPDEVDLDLEDELEFRTKKRRRPCLQEKSFVKGRKRKRNSEVSKRSLKRNPRKNRLPKKQTIDGVCRQKRSIVTERTSRSSVSKKRRTAKISDSDYAITESSDFEYTISEEEREQVKEASKFCQDLTISVSHSSSKKRLQKGGSLQQRKRHEKKGKEKVADLKVEAVKPTCGICLSEEGKKTVRGTLNCCDHYFCFACIMEWSKVESRCPLCKQRFVAISKPARSTTGFDLRTAVVQVPERDQVYQPSEDELRDYIDPYIDVICTECHQGGDDALMLLCDLCDSPAHTFCVGLGRDVPEGNWYCEGCKPAALASLDPQTPDLTPNHTGTDDFPSRSPENVRVAIDLNRAYVPEVPFAEGNGLNPTPRHHGVDPPAASGPGAGVLTVSERRRIQLQINNLLNSRIGHFSGRGSGMSPTTLGTQVMQGTEVAFPRPVTQEALISHHYFPQGRLLGITTPSLQSGNFLQESLTRGNFVPGQAYPSTDGVLGGGRLQGITTPSFYSPNFLYESSTNMRGNPVSSQAYVPTEGLVIGGRLQSITTPSFQRRNYLLESSYILRGNPGSGQAYASNGGFVSGILGVGVPGTNGDASSRLDYEQRHPNSSRPSVADSSLPHYNYREVSNFR